MTAKDDCAHVTFLGMGSTTGVANIDYALRARHVVFNSQITDGAAAAQDFYVVRFPVAVTILNAWLVPAGTVAKDGTDYNVTSLFYANGLGGAPVLLGSQSTKVTAWAAGVSQDLAVAETTIASGSALQITGVLGGAGKKYVPYSVTIEYKVA
jgi:hypothetical protein